MSKKADLITRLTATLASLTAVNFAVDTANAKREMLEAIRKSHTGFGVLADSMETIGVVKALAEEGKRIKRLDFTDVDLYIATLKEHKHNSVTAIEQLLEEVQNLPEDAGKPDPVVGTLGERTPFLLKVATIMDPNDFKELKSGDIAKHFIASKYFQQLVADRDLVLAKQIQKSIMSPAAEGGLGVIWPEKKKGQEDQFYKLYRLMRPTIIRALAKAREAYMESIDKAAATVASEENGEEVEETTEE